ncbi:MAG: nucleotide exchange factor GrpE [Tepidiformaceae bacterium]
MQGNEDDRMVDKRAASRMNGEDAGKVSAAESSDAPVEDAANLTPEQQLAAAKEQAETNYRSWQRTAADFQNYKRRIEQERSESARFASAALVINMLPVYDDLDRAVNSVDAHLAGLNWVQGVVAIQRKFALLLEAMGVKELSAAGESFDPERHEAVGKQAGDEGKVLHVVQKGYMLGEKVIRPAMVIVGEGS